MKAFNSKNEIHNAFLSVFKGQKVNTMLSGDALEAFGEIPKIMNNAESDIDASVLACELIAGVIVIESYLKRESKVIVKNGKTYLPRPAVRDYMIDKRKDFAGLVENLAITAKQ